MLAPIAWRTPPRHYGPWELFASLLTEGLVAAGHDVTLFATADSVTTGDLAAPSPRGWSEDDVDRPEGRRVPAHRCGVRARRRVRHHPQRLRLPAADLQRARRHAGRDHDPRLLVAADRPGLRALRRDDDLRGDQRRRPPPRLHYAATIHHGIDTDAFAVDPAPGEHLLFFGRIHPDKGTAHAIEVARRTGRRLDIAGIIQDQRYFDDEVEPHLDGDAGPLPRPGRRRRPVARCSAARTPCCTSSTSTSRSASASSRRWRAARP